MIISADFFDMLFDSGKLIQYGGLTLLLLIIFAETGLFFGFFFPGDALLFTGGVLCGTNDLPVNIFILLCAVTLAAIAGNITGYYSGRVLGPRLFKKEDGFFFKKSHLEKARMFYHKYGGGSIVAGRFLPIVRTFVPIVAGAIRMEVKKFMVYNVSGAFLWVWSLTLAGYFLGSKFPNILKHIELFILGFFIITSAFLIRGYLKLRRIKKVKKVEQKQDQL